MDNGCWLVNWQMVNDSFCVGELLKVSSLEVIYRFCCMQKTTKMYNNTLFSLFAFIFLFLIADFLSLGT